MGLSSHRRVREIDITDTDHMLKVDNGTTHLTLSHGDGSWTELALEGVQIINHHCIPSIPADFRVDGEWMVETHGAAFLRHQIEENLDGGTLTLDYEVKPLPIKPTIPMRFVKSAPGSSQDDAAKLRFCYTMSCHFIVPSDGGTLGRSISVRRNKERDQSGTRTVKFGAFLFRLPGVTIGPTESCLIEMPGAMKSKGPVIKPRTPYNDVVTRYIHGRTSPDVDFGVVVFWNPSVNRYLASWLETSRTAHECHLAGNGHSVELLMSEEYPAYLHDGYTAASHVQTLRLGTGDQRHGLRAYSRYLTESATPMAKVPSWVRDAVIMEISPEYFDGFVGIRNRLHQLKDTGFNTLYLMPLNKGGYWVADHYDIDEKRHGSVNDLKGMVAEAHRLGMHVLMDLLVVMLTDDSPLVAEHPEYFVRDKVGRILPHAEWEFPSTDYANEEYREYIVNFAVHCVREFGVDGFRVDAPGSKSPNWYPHSGRQPWETTMGAYEILRSVNGAIKAVNPDAILLDELGGPICYEVCDIGHNHGSFYRIMNDADEQERSTFTLRDYKNLLSNVQNTMPDGVNRVYYMRNHDTAWFYRFDGYTPRFYSFEAIHCLIKGIPLVFGGQKPGDGASDAVRQRCLWSGPDDAAFRIYRRLFHVRRSARVLIDGACLFDEIDAHDDRVFSVLRTLDGRTVIVLVSDASEELGATVRIADSVLTGHSSCVQLVDLFGSATLQVTNLSSFTVRIPPYGVMALDVRDASGGVDWESEPEFSQQQDAPTGGGI